MAWAKTFKDAKDASDWMYLVCAVFSCGYSQPKRDHLSEAYLLQGTAETDCSYGVNWALWKGKMLPECIGFSTRTMIDYLEAQGFTLCKFGSIEPQRNDVLWKTGHTAMYIGDGLQAEALRTERYDAGYSGSTPGDQDGGETVVRALTDDWTYILRPPVKEEKKNGWFKEDGIWHYYMDGEIQTNTWAKYGSDWYYMGSDGAAVKSTWIKSDGSWYYFHADGKMARDEIVRYKGGYAAVMANGRAVKGGKTSVTVAVKDWYVQLPE